MQSVMGALSVQVCATIRHSERRATIQHSQKPQGPVRC